MQTDAQTHGLGECCAIDDTGARTQADARAHRRHSTAQNACKAATAATAAAAAAVVESLAAVCERAGASDVKPRDDCLRVQ